MRAQALKSRGMTMHLKRAINNHTSKTALGRVGRLWELSGYHESKTHKRRAVRALPTRNRADCGTGPKSGDDRP